MQKIGNFLLKFLTMDSGIIRDIIILLQGALIMLSAIYAIHFFCDAKDRASIREAAQLRVLIGITFGWLSFSYLFGYFFLYEPLHSSSYARIITSCLDLMLFPFFNMVLTNVTHRKKITRYLVLSHFVPFVVALLVALCVGKTWTVALAVAITLLYVLVMTFVQVRAGIQYNKYIRNQYSSLKGRDMSQLLWLTGLYFVLAMGWGFEEYKGNDISRIICNVLGLSILPILKGMLQEIVITREVSKVDSEKIDESHESEFTTVAVEEKVSNTADVVDESKVEQFKQKLVDVCEKTQLYISDDITRDDLCREMGTNHTYFTKFLKLATGKTFNEYINSLRIDYAETLLADVSIPLNDIPSLVGFSSKSAYYSAFKSRHHCTPLEYRNR